MEMKRNVMPANKRYKKTVNCHLPDKVCAEIEHIMHQDEKIQSEVVRELLVLGLRARRIEC